MTHLEITSSSSKWNVIRTWTLTLRHLLSLEPTKQQCNREGNYDSGNWGEIMVSKVHVLLLILHGNTSQLESTCTIYIILKHEINKIPVFCFNKTWSADVTTLLSIKIWCWYDYFQPKTSLSEVNFSFESLNNII